MLRAWRMNDLPRTRQGLNAWRWWLPLLVILTLFAAWQSTWRYAGIDFHAQATVSQLVGQPGYEDVYSGGGADAVRARILEQSQGPDASQRLVDAARFNRTLQSTVTPFCFAVFQSLWNADYDFALGRYRILLLLGIAFGTYFFARAAGGTSLEAWIGAALVGGSWFEPLHSLLRTGNVSSLQLAVLALVLVLARGGPVRQLAAGAVLGLLVMFKPNVAAVLPLGLISRISMREWRRLRFEVAGVLLGVITALGLSWHSFGTLQPWLDWAAFIPQFLADPPGPASGNYSLAQLLGGRWTQVLVLGALALALVAVYRSPGVENDARTVALGLGVTLLSAPLVWLHYYVLAIPLFVVVMVSGRGGRMWTALRCAFGTTAFALLSLQPILSLIPTHDPTVLAWMYAWATIGLFTWVAVDGLWPPRAAPRAVHATAVPSS